MTHEEEIDHAVDFLVDRKFEVNHFSWLALYIIKKGNFHRILKDDTDLIEFVQALEHVQPKHDIGRYASWQDCWGGGYE